LMDPKECHFPDSFRTLFKLKNGVLCREAATPD
jgi:hypothetical protein